MSSQKKTNPVPRALPKDRDSLMDALEKAFDKDDADLALDITNELISRYPDDEEALCLHATALNMSGETDEALEFCGQALEAHPASLGLIHETVSILIQEGDDDPEALEDALDLLLRGISQGEKDALEAVRAGAVPEVDDELMELEQNLSDLYLQCTDVYTMIEDPNRALDAANKAKALFPDDPDVRTNHAAALFELSRFDEARDELMGVIKDEPENAWALYTLALCLDHTGHSGQADELIAKAVEYDPDTYTSPVRVSEKAFDKMLEKAMSKLPEKVRSYLSNVAVLVEDLPSYEDLTQENPPMSPNCLGLFRGTPGPSQSVSDPWSSFPSAIVLYQRNLERFVADREQLEDEIRVTLLHEVGHFLGLDEDQVAKLGLR